MKAISTAILFAMLAMSSAWAQEPAQRWTIRIDTFTPPMEGVDAVLEDRVALAWLSWDTEEQCRDFAEYLHVMWWTRNRDRYAVRYCAPVGAATGNG